jgi:hypothetical protein
MSTPQLVVAAVFAGCLMLAAASWVGYCVGRRVEAAERRANTAETELSRADRLEQYSRALDTEEAARLRAERKARLATDQLDQAKRTAATLSAACEKLTADLKHATAERDALLERFGPLAQPISVDDDAVRIDQVWADGFTEPDDIEHLSHTAQWRREPSPDAGRAAFDPDSDAYKAAQRALEALEMTRVDFRAFGSEPDDVRPRATVKR